ncbi:MAG: hypothetical protein EB015_18550, partial [Methylocystaceae bacterium]|nr:hypothetical protein [Methylocystaceae bacterium]
MGSDRSDGDDNVVSIFGRGSHHESRYRGILESRDPKFQNLVERYLSKVGHSLTILLAAHWWYGVNPAACF